MGIIREDECSQEIRGRARLLYESFVANEIDPLASFAKWTELTEIRRSNWCAVAVAAAAAPLMMAEEDMRMIEQSIKPDPALSEEHLAETTEFQLEEHPLVDALTEVLAEKIADQFAQTEVKDRPGEEPRRVASRPPAATKPASSAELGFQQCVCNPATARSGVCVSCGGLVTG